MQDHISPRRLRPLATLLKRKKKKEDSMPGPAWRKNYSATFRDDFASECAKTSRNVVEGSVLKSYNRLGKWLVAQAM